MVQQQNTTPCVSNFITEVRAKEPERDEIKLKSEQFFADGGKIKNISNGVSGVNAQSAGIPLSRSQQAKVHLEGMVFGKLTVISRSKDRTLHQYWNCVCECGEKDVIEKSCLMEGRTTACKACRSKSRKPKKSTKAKPTKSRGA